MLAMQFILKMSANCKHVHYTDYNDRSSTCITDTVHVGSILLRAVKVEMFRFHFRLTLPMKTRRCPRLSCNLILHSAIYYSHMRCPFYRG